MVVNVEDAGFEIRDTITWLYGSGFPKSLNVGKTIEKFKKTGNASWNGTGDSSNGALGYSKLQKEQGYRAEDYSNRHQNKTEIDNEWEGWGTALKPASEYIVLARKPLSEKSVAENVLKWGTGGINVDGCRVGYTSEADEKSSIPGSLNSNQKNSSFGIGEGHQHNTEGRFPANLILECICDEVIKGEKGEVKKSNGRVRENHEYNSVGNMGSYDGEGTIDNYNDKGDTHTNPNCPCYLLDEQSGFSKGVVGSKRVSGPKQIFNEPGTSVEKQVITGGKADNGGASRFFYQAKVSKAERNMGLDELEETTTAGKGHGLDRRCSHCNTSMLKPEDCKCEEPNWITPAKKNTHPTVKPVNLMTYLCRMITPQGGIVLDPFVGSGSTGIAARLEGFRFVGMEMDKDYFKIAEARIENFEDYRKFIKK
jgi:site-specific DNA-methyltransferase (adenine-specific)